MSDQPTEKHEFVPHENCSGNGNHCVHKGCNLSRDADVHQPSAVQAPVQATPLADVAIEVLRGRKHFDGWFGRIDEDIQAEIRTELNAALMRADSQAVRIVELESQTATQAWEASPNRAFDGKQCTECGFDNRFHAETCLFQGPSLRITSAAFNALHDEKKAQAVRIDELEDALREMLRWEASGDAPQSKANAVLMVGAALKPKEGK